MGYPTHDKDDGLYALVNLDENGKIKKVLKRGGSSTPVTVRAFASEQEARRSQNRAGGTIIRVIDFEVING